MSQKAIVVGASGVAGRALAQRLQKNGFDVYGLARRPLRGEPGVTPVVADLNDQGSVERAVSEVKPSHIFFTAWTRRATEAENIVANAAMVRNVLNAASRSGAIEHVALVTGLKHYLGPFEAYGQGALPATPFREDQSRLPVENFYYAQEDELFAAAERDGFSWSVHRPHTIIGYAVGNAMNMGVTLAVYASLCKANGWPFLFPGSAVQWSHLTDMTDADMLARQIVWAAKTEAARNQAFNVTNGDVFRWRWMWSKLADWFGLEAAPLEGDGVPLERQLADAAPVWAGLAQKYGLIQPDLGILASPWHTDADLGRPIEVVTDMSKSRALGFLDYEATDACFYRLFEKLRAHKVIP